MLTVWTGVNHSVLKVAGLLLVLCGVAACGGDDQAADDVETPPSVALDGSRWEVVEIDGESIEIDVNTIETPRISFRETTVAGHDGCNGFGADYSLNGSALTLGNAEGTEEGCTIPDGSNQSILPNLVLGSHFGLVEDFEVTVDADTMTWTGSAHTVVLQAEE